MTKFLSGMQVLTNGSIYRNSQLVLITKRTRFLNSDNETLVYCYKNQGKHLKEKNIPRTRVLESLLWTLKSAARNYQIIVINFNRNVLCENVVCDDGLEGRVAREC